MQGHHDESRQYKYSMSNSWCGNSGARGARWYNNSRRENEKKNIDPRAQTKHLLIFPGRWHGQLTLRLFPISTLYVSNILNIWQEKISYSKTAYLSSKDSELRSVHFWIDAGLLSRRHIFVLTVDERILQPQDLPRASAMKERIRVDQNVVEAKGFTNLQA